MYCFVFGRVPALLTALCLLPRSKVPISSDPVYEFLCSQINDSTAPLGASACSSMHVHFSVCVSVCHSARGSVHVCAFIQGRVE